MSLRRTFAITARLLAQFRHDHRTLAILFVTPLIVLALFAALFRTDTPDPIVGIVVGNGTLAEPIATALEENGGLDARRISSSDSAEDQLVEGTLDAYIVLPDHPGDGGVYRPEVVLEGTDPAVGSAVVGALQPAILSAAGQLMPVPADGPPVLPTVDPDVRTLYGNEDLDTLDLLGGPFIGLLVLLLVYIVTSVSFLRERTLQERHRADKRGAVQGSGPQHLRANPGDARLQPPSYFLRRTPFAVEPTRAGENEKSRP
jgi:ABC-2 type transport system permease protein